MRLTYELVEPPFPLFPCDVEDHVARKYRIGNAEDFALKAADGGPVPANIDDDAFHSLSKALMLGQPCTRPAMTCIQCPIAFEQETSD